MREIGQETVPTSEIDKETFLSLRLAEPSERVKITLDERMLSIEGKRNATIDMRLNAIATMKHHSTNLVPTWLILLGGPDLDWLSRHGSVNLQIDLYQHRCHLTS